MPKPKQVLIMFATLISSINYVTAQDLDWAFKVTGTGTEPSEIVVDAVGNIYIVGEFEDTADFDPSVNDHLLSSNGYNLFLAKYDPNGAHIWSFVLDFTESWGNDIALDPLGDIIITGYIIGSGDVDPGSGTTILNSQGGENPLIAKFDSAGNFIWAFNITGNSTMLGGMGNSSKVDELGNIYITGGYDATCDLDPGVGIYNITASSFIAKYTPDGAFVWGSSLGGSFGKMELDNDNFIFVFGQFLGTVDFDPSGGTANLTSNGDFDLFLAKYDSDGIYQWVIGIGGEGFDRIDGIDVDNTGNAYVIGEFRDTVDFDPGVGVSILAADSLKSEGFIAKYDGFGNFAWAFNLTGNDGFYNICTNNEYIYVTGGFTGSLDFDPTFNNDVKTAISEDPFIACYDLTGKYQWSSHIVGYAIYPDPGTWFDGIAEKNGAIYVAGSIYDSCDFDPGPGTHFITSDILGDMCVAKYKDANVAVYDVKPSTMISVYPNPTTDLLRIQSSTEIETLDLYNLVGQEVYLSEIQRQKYEVTCSVAGLSAGLYILTVNGTTNIHVVVIP